MFLNKEDFQLEFSRRVVEQYGRTVGEAHITEKFMVLETMVRDYASVNWSETKQQIAKKQQKQMHYFSMEFLMGRLLTNNLMNLGIYDVVKEGLAEFDININELEELESDPGLGNGGLGRLAACFLDSLASLELAGHGNTIRYEYGLFKQKIENGYQVEVPDQWMKLGNMWEVRKPKHAVEVKFGGRIEVRADDSGNLKFEHVDAEQIRAVPYDMPIVGRDTKVTNTLRLWNAEASDILPKNIDFRRYTQEVRDICQTLYPDDSTEDGRRLRLKQQYFFVSAGVIAIVRAHLRKYPSLDNLHEKNVIQLNDTHPVLVIPELMRILVDEYHYDWNTAWNIVSHTCAYTNHTILAEALEKWPIQMVRSLLPRIYMIIEEINNRFTNFVRMSSLDEDKVRRLSIIKDGHVHMAHLAIAGSFSVNGVAELHSQILMNQEMKEFSDLYPNKFNNKTNGITHRRWLAYSNKELSSLLHDTIGDGWIKDPSQLENLMNFVDDSSVQERFMNVKLQRKQIMADYIKAHNGIEVDVNSIFDIQVKRLHAYKRQLLNVLHVIYLYKSMKNDPNYRIYPRTFIFGAKAAPAYHFAKKVIKLINSVADVVNNDPETNKYLKVVFLENYGVSLAEIIMPSADVSEQISTAGKEASGTGNMKFMMNGAITIGTYDGANVEISREVGMDNCVIFGLRDEEVNDLRRSGTYSAWSYYNDDNMIKEVLNSLIDGSWNTSKEEFGMIFDELMSKNDEYFLLADFKSYVEAQHKVEELYRNRQQWAKICLTNVAKSGFFSSDRTIKEYASEIWHIEPVKF